MRCPRGTAERDWTVRASVPRSLPGSVTLIRDFGLTCRFSARRTPAGALNAGEAERTIRNRHAERDAGLCAVRHNDAGRRGGRGGNADMTKELDGRISDATVARGGLLSRRQLMSGGLALGGAVAAGSLGMIETAQAATELPDWAKVAGLPVRGYGMPAEQEAHVKRAVLQFYKDLAPEYSFSGTPLQHLRGTITPNGLHFEVHHGGRPELDPAAHRLMVHGLVDRALKFDLASLERYPMVSRVHFIECTGNSFFNALFPDPMQAGCDVLHGLVSNSEWSGVPLSILMEEAGVKPEGRWLIATGDDGPSLARSIPMEKVMEDGMLALYQNGERLRPEQGYPMRLLLPGYEGNMCIKWVTSLWVTDAPFTPRTSQASTPTCGRTGRRTSSASPWT